MPAMTPLKSNQIESVGFEGGELWVTFKTGAVYLYSAVPQEVYDGLLKSESPGKYFGQAVKGKFEYRKLADTSKTG